MANKFDTDSVQQPEQVWKLTWQAPSMVVLGQKQTEGKYSKYTKETTAPPFSYAPS